MSRRDRKLFISATACDSDRKESQGVANKVLAGFHMIAESRKQTWSLILQLAAIPCDSLRSYGNQAIAVIDRYERAWKFYRMQQNIVQLKKLSLQYSQGQMKSSQ